jgi:uncharacterized protein
VEDLNMHIVASGITGFIGSHLKRDFVEKRGWIVEPLRTSDFSLSDNEFLNKMNGADIIIHLAGAPIAARWTEDHKKLLYSSRIDTTRKIVESIARLEKKPRLFISTSAIGRYASVGLHTEKDYSYASDFLGRLAEKWEDEALKAIDTGVRTLIFRVGVVLGRDGGMLAGLLPPFRMGLGGVIGSGKQGFSWIHINDLVAAYVAAINNNTFSGIYNLCAPNPVTNEVFTKELGKALHRPTIFRIPVFALRLKFGEGAASLASGQLVLPKRLMDAGFRFSFPTIGEAIRDIVKSRFA